ncbi:MAG: hypothetical protein GY913_21120 [Proteobacteria bacterium]|nr:hypothetical protein [Pseudomonadota bacterium]MCP4919410.1 hypothetical protein [Pseudomonadota bacterium]
MLTFLLACAPDMWRGNQEDAEGALDVPTSDAIGELGFDAESVHIDHVCGSAETTLTLSNDGDGTLRLDAIQIAGDWEVEPIVLPLDLAPGELVGLQLTTTGGDGLLRFSGPDLDAEVPLTSTLDEAPTLSLVTPVDSATVDVSSSLTMEAWAHDDVDGPEDLTVRWRSDLDGELSVYPPLDDGSLAVDWISSARSPGTHEVTIDVTDSCGNLTSDSVTVCQSGGFALGELPESAFLYSGHASWDAENACVELTPAEPYRTGSVFVRDQVMDASAVQVEFEFSAGLRDGADGMALVALDVDRMSNTLGAEGCGLGYGDPSSGCIDGGQGLPGWQLEIDTYFNEELDESEADHIALSIDGDQQTVLLYAEIPEVEDGEWHRVEVEILDGNVLVVLDGTTVLDEAAHIEPFDAWIGFSGATGGHVNQHLVDALVVRDDACL